MALKNRNDIFNYAIKLSESNQIDLAIEVFQKIYKYNPRDYVTLYHIARLYLEKKDYTKATGYYHYLINVNPLNIQAKFDLAYIYLINRDCRKGFYFYENRIHFDAYNRVKPHKYPTCIEEIKNKKIFIYSEQGFGDTLNFIRYIDLLEQYTTKINIYIQKPLVSLLKSNYKNFNFVCTTGFQDIKYDFVFPLLSIPFLLKLESFIPIKKYLDIKNQDKKKRKKKRILKVGLCWQGEYKNKRDKYRSFNIDDFLKKVYSSDIKNIEKIQFYSFQKDIRVSSDNVIDLGRFFSDFYDTAIAVEKMDLMITVDTAVAHLSGAMGKKTYLLLPFSSDWRWGDTLLKSDLYKSIKYFRQVQKGSWDEPFSLVISKLKKLKLK